MDTPSGLVTMPEEARPRPIRMLGWLFAEGYQQQMAGRLKPALWSARWESWLLFWGRHDVHAPQALRKWQVC